MNPYEEKSIESWYAITEELVNNHPLKPYNVDICLKSWNSILNGKINTYFEIADKRNASIASSDRCLNTMIRFLWN